jgi:hypothetical protein
VSLVELVANKMVWLSSFHVDIVPVFKVLYV